MSSHQGSRAGLCSRKWHGRRRRLQAGPTLHRIGAELDYVRGAGMEPSYSNYGRIR